MTNEELTAIEERANAATREPWEGTKNSGVVSKHDACDTVFETGCGCCTDKALSAEDAAFIAAARVDVPALIAEVRSLRAERDALRMVYKAAAAYCDDRTVLNEHALIDAVGEIRALAVQP